MHRFILIKKYCEPYDAQKHVILLVIVQCPQKLLLSFLGNAMTLGALA